MTKCSNVPQPVSVIHLFAIFCRWLAVNYKFSQGHATVQLTKWNIFFCSKAPNGNISYSSTVRPVVYIKQFPVHRKVNTGKLDGHSKCVCTLDGLYWRLTVLKIMDAGYCLYVHIFMKNIISLKPINFYNSNQFMPDLRFQQSRRDNWIQYHAFCSAYQEVYIICKNHIIR